MVKRCFRGLMFVLEMPPLKEPVLSRFIFSLRTKLISAKTISLKKEMEIEDI